MPELARWENFYVIIGSAAGALIGLQFVIMTLIADSPTLRPEAGAAFGTPTVVYFSTVLLLSALLNMPLQTVPEVIVPCALTGLGGLAYTLIVTRRIHRQDVYKPECEDWLFHALLPLAAYAILTASSFMAFTYMHTALFGIGGAALLLLFIGIHNAWDAVSYHVFVTRNKENSK
jgi:hypothetical protein